MITITMFPASFGDSFLVSLTHQECKFNLLIDCGFAQTYDNHIKEKLVALKAEGEQLERLIITHLDRDHINGAIPLLKDNRSKQIAHIIPIKQIWHNTFRHMQSAKLPKSDFPLVEAEKVKSFIIVQHELDTTAEESQISAKTSSEVGSLILSGNYQWNTDFDEKAVVIDNKKDVQINEMIGIRLLAPTQKRLEDVEYLFKVSLRKIGIDADRENEIIDDAFEVFLRNKDLWDIDTKETTISAKQKAKELSVEDVLALGDQTNYKPDTEKPNGSSMAFILKFQSQELLFLADSFAEDILDEINTIEGHTGYFDLIKISHHGASGNTSPYLLEKIDSEFFLISTDGNHPLKDHPDNETLARIVSRPVRPGKNVRKLIFNFETPAFRLFDNSILKSHFKYEMIIAEEIKL
jgi:beta-lactamase superfamily II metal-dependent hydrolase